MQIKTAIKFTLLLSIAICVQIFLTALSVKAEQKTYTDNEVNISKKDLIILIEKLSGNLGSDIYDIADHANTNDEYIKRSVDELNKRNIIDANVSFEDLGENLKKEEVYYILAKYIGIDAAEGKTSFNDDEKLKPWSKVYIKELEDLGIIEGKDKSFEPDKILNRADLRNIIKELFLVVINSSKKFRAEDNNTSRAFIIVNSNDAVIENIKTQNPLLISPKASNGRLRILNSDISNIYIAQGSQNFELQLSGSKVLFAKNRGKNISYTYVEADSKVSPLPDPQEYKPAQRKVVTRIIKSGRSNTSSGASGSLSQSNKEAFEKGGAQDNSISTPQGGRVAEGNKTVEDGRSSNSEIRPDEGDRNNSGNNSNEKSGESFDSGDQNKNYENNNEETPVEDPYDKLFENAREDLLILNEHLYADKTLKYNASTGVSLEENALIGLKLTGENNGTKLNVKWEGKDLEKVKNAQKGEYLLVVSSLEDLVINGKNYGKVKFTVKIIIE